MSFQLDLELHPRQFEALLTDANEVLYGGAAGGGKSHLMRVAAIMWCAAIAGLQVYLFRRIREDLVKNHLEGPKGFRSLLAPAVNRGLVNIVDDEIRFKNGSKIYLCHCKDEKDRFKYLGAEIHVLLIDELTTFTDVIYRFLRNRVRAVGLKLTGEYAGRFPRILCGSNPGNVGHHWVKQDFVDAGDMEVVRQPAKEGGMLRQFILAKLEDNPSMAEDDPGYEDRLEGLGSPALVAAMRHGDWSVIEGAFFPEWSEKLHVLKPFAIPPHWTRIVGFDWGSASPFSVGWWAVASDDTPRPEGVIPRGALVRYREWYGAGRPNKGLKLQNTQIAEGILEREKLAGDPRQSERIELRVADPAIFSEQGGPSIAETFSAGGVHFIAADNKRVPQMGSIGGWEEVRRRLVGTMRDVGGEIVGRPMLYSFATCTAFNRQMPTLQHDPLRAEDVDTEMEDHAADEGRYVCMSRPWTAPTPKAGQKHWEEDDAVDWRTS